MVSSARRPSGEGPHDETGAESAPDNAPKPADVPAFLRGIVIVAALIASAILGAYLWNVRPTEIRTISEWGAVGDFFGGMLNPAFAFAGLIALLHTIGLQSKELRASTEELARSAAALTAQNAVLAKQTFEATFFQLLKLHADIVMGMTTARRRSELTGSTARGRDVFKLIVKESARFWHYTSDTYGLMPEENRRTQCASIYQPTYDAYADLLGHYFRTLYRILAFIDRSEMSPIERQFYAKLLRAQLSRYELVLIFYNCAFPPAGNEKLRPLVARYNMLKHLDRKDLVLPEHAEHLPDCVPY